MSEAWKTLGIAVFIALCIFLHLSSLQDKEIICRESVNPVAKVTD